MFESNVETMCSSLRSKSLFNPEKVQGSTMQSLWSNPVTSHDFHWCSTDLSPDPSTFDTTSPGRSASLHPPDLKSVVANLVSAEVKPCDGFVDAQGIGQDLEEM